MSVAIKKIEPNDYPVLIALFNEFAEFEKLPELMTNSVKQMQSKSNLINGFCSYE